jgi:hypothetical protein
MFMDSPGKKNNDKTIKNERGEKLTLFLAGRDQ